jgi:hypothetical protein
LKKEEYIEKLNKIMLLLNNKLGHSLKLHHFYNKIFKNNKDKDDLLDFTTDVICEKCNNNFELDLVYNESYYDNNFEGISYCFNCFDLGDGLVALNCIDIKCNDLIIKGIIE